MKALPLVVLCVAATAPLGPAAAEDEDPAANLKKLCAEIRCYPAGTTRIIMEDGTTAEFHTEFTLPIVQDGMVAIYPGVTLFLAGEIEDGKIVNLRAVDEPEALVNTLKLEMDQKDGKPDTFLVVTNYFPEIIRFTAGMMLPTGDEVHETSSCAVMSNGPISIEHWPQPIFQLVLHDFRVESDGEIRCY